MAQSLSKDEVEAIEAAIDAAFLKLCGKTYRDAPLAHAERNGDSSHEPDSWEKIQRDFPQLFGGAA